jgi:hypothetical protein
MTDDGFRSFSNPACLNQELRLEGGSNALFLDCMTGLKNLLAFVNVQRQRGSYIGLKDGGDTSLLLSTPLMTDSSRQVFKSDVMDIPKDLPAAVAMGYAVMRQKALYLEDNNISVMIRKKSPSNSWVMPLFIICD